MTNYTLIVGCERDSLGNRISGRLAGAMSRKAEQLALGRFDLYIRSSVVWAHSSKRKGNAVRFDILTDEPPAAVRAWADHVRRIFKQREVFICRTSAEVEFLAVSDQVIVRAA